MILRRNPFPVISSFRLGEAGRHFSTKPGLLEPVLELKIAVVHAHRKPLLDHERHQLEGRELGLKHGRLLAVQVGVRVLEQLLGVVRGQPQLVQVQPGHAKFAQLGKQSLKPLDLFGHGGDLHRHVPDARGCPVQHPQVVVGRPQVETNFVDPGQGQLPEFCLAAQDPVGVHPDVDIGWT
jgi:hypothetical protein